MWANRECVYRIYRDTRFSKDKTPYKTYASALFLRNGFNKYSGGAAYYFAVSPENIEVAEAFIRRIGTSCWRFVSHCGKPQAIPRDFQFAEVRKLLGELQGDSVSVCPKVSIRSIPRRT